MSNQALNSERAAELSVLVNPERIRSSIKRLFYNKIDEVLSEILQNSQRAGATQVDISTTPDSFTIEDNGHGLIGGIDGFHTLLKLAESNFDNETIEDQDPMGVGIVSLLTHDQISSVTFSSGSLELTINTKRWWNDPDYYSVWFERLVTLEQPVSGLRISASCTPELVTAVEKSLAPKDQIYTYTDDLFHSASPAQGYQGILKITLNSQKVRTSLPAWTKLANPLVTTTYQGCKIQIGYNDSGRRSSILWYGQLIRQRGLASSFDFHLEVTSGRPVNPLSPSRTGIILDAAYQDLMTFIKAEIFAFIFDPKNRARIKPAHITACFKLDHAYALAHSPYIVAETIHTNDSPESLEDFNTTSDTDLTNKPLNQLFTYAESPLLLTEQVFIQLPAGVTEAEYGLRTFLAQTGPAYTLKDGDASQLTIGTLWWKPKGKPQHDWFYQPGHYGISYETQIPPSKWLPITKGPVFAFSLPSSYDVNEVDFIVGTTDTPIDFLNNQVWAAFDPNDDSDHDPQEESYRSTVNDLIRSIIGNCVPRDFTLYEISRFLKDSCAPIVSINYHYKTGGKFINPRRAYKPSNKNVGTMSPSEITVKSATGEKVRLKLY